MVKDKTCLKYPTNLTCIDLIITKRPKSSQESKVNETGLSDFLKMSQTVTKVIYHKQIPKVIQYRKYKNFSNEVFMHELKSTLSIFSHISVKIYKTTVDNILKKHAPIKRDTSGQICSSHK